MRIFALSIAMFALAACSSRPAPLPGSEKDYPRVEIEGFAVPGKSMNFLGEDILLFDYETEEQTTSDLVRLSDDGRMLDGVALPWSIEPVIHIFATGRQIALYPGSTIAVLNALLQEGGEQIVGDPLPEGVTYPASSASASSAQ